MANNTAKLLRQLKRAQRAGRGERLRVKQPPIQLRESKSSWKYCDLYGRDVNKELSRCVVEQHLISVSKTANTVDVTAIGDAVKKTVIGYPRCTITCNTCDEYWDVSEETAERFLKHLRQANRASATGRSLNTPNLQNLPP